MDSTSLLQLRSTEEFKAHISASNAIVMIHKTHCPYCERAVPWLESLSSKFPSANIALANKDDIVRVLDVFQVKMYPTFVAFKEGKVTNVFYGDTVEHKVNDFVERNV